MPPGCGLSQDQTLKFIPDLRKSSCLLKGRPMIRAAKRSLRCTNIRAALSRRPRIPSLFSTISNNNPRRGSDQNAPHQGGAALIDPPHPRVNTRFSPGTDKSSGRSEPGPERDALHAAYAACHTAFSWKSKSPTPKGAATLPNKTPTPSCPERGHKNLPNTLTPGQAGPHLRQDAPEQRSHPTPSRGAKHKTYAVRQTGSNRVSPIVKRHRMFRFGEKQPTFDNEAEGGAGKGEPRCDPADETAEDQGEQAKEGGHREAGKPGDTTQAPLVLARDAEAHLLEQVILFGMRRLEHTHLAPAAEQGRGADRASRRCGVYEAPILFLDPPGYDHDDQGQERNA